MSSGANQPTQEELQRAYEEITRLRNYRKRYNERLDVKEKNREKQRQYYEANRELVLQKRKKAYTNDPEKFIERSKVAYYVRKEEAKENV